MASWCEGRWRASVYLGVDYIYVIGWATALALVIGFAARAPAIKDTGGARWFAVLSFLPFSFAVTDAVENAMLFPLVARDFNPWADWVTAVYRIKQSLVVVAAIVAAIAVVTWLVPAPHRATARRKQAKVNEAAPPSPPGPAS